MPKIKEEKAREKRIRDEIIVDTYDEMERALSWYYYLEEKLNFPFLARCTGVRVISPLEKGDEVEVTGMASEEECEHEMFVEIRWEKRPLAVPLSQLAGINPDQESRQAIADWHYWVKRGYQF